MSLWRNLHPGLYFPTPRHLFCAAYAIYCMIQNHQMPVTRVKSEQSQCKTQKCVCQWIHVKDKHNWGKIPRKQRNILLDALFDLVIKIPQSVGCWQFQYDISAYLLPYIASLIISPWVSCLVWLSSLYLSVCLEMFHCLLQMISSLSHQLLWLLLSKESNQHWFRIKFRYGFNIDETSVNNQLNILYIHTIWLSMAMLSS